MSQSTSINRVLEQMRQVSSQLHVSQQQNTQKAAEVQDESNSFAHMLKDAVSSVNELQNNSTELARAFEMGEKSVSLSDLMVAREKSGLAFDALVQTRNKILSAYKEIMESSM